MHELEADANGVTQNWNQLAGTYTLTSQNSVHAPYIKSDGGADVKIMDRFFRHREVPDYENFSKPGFQLKTA